MLSFQKLDVYRCAIEFLALSTGLAQNLPKGHAGLAEQLRRAALSIPLNIGEAAGRTSEADAARHYAIARGSAMECAANRRRAGRPFGPRGCQARASHRPAGAHRRHAD